jgi:S1-C subfamily serine protease
MSVVAQQVDWSGLRAAAVVIGVREAARQASSHLPPDEQRRFTQRVMQRSHREGWIRSKLAATVKTTQAMPLSANVSNGSDALVNQLADDSKATRIGLSKGLRKAAEHISALDGDQVTKQAQNVRHVASASSAVHGWEEQKQGPNVMVNVALLGVAPADVLSDAKVIELEPGE